MSRVKVRFIAKDGRRKPGMLGKMTREKADEMIEKNIVEEYTGHFTRNLGREHKLKFNLKNLK
jgi:hypothetical protein